MTWWSADIGSPLKAVAEIGDKDCEDRVGARTSVLCWPAVRREVRRTAVRNGYAAGPGIDILGRLARDIDPWTCAKRPG